MDNMVDRIAKVQEQLPAVVAGLRAASPQLPRGPSPFGGQVADGDERG